MTDTSWVIVDTETDGLREPIHVLEVAAQRMHGWAPQGPAFRVLLDHGVPIAPEVSAIHGYTAEYLRAHGEEPRRAYERFRSYIGETPLVSHNLAFDWNRTLEPEWQRLGLPRIGQRGFCCLMLARRLVRQAESYRLQALRESFRLPANRGHRAGSDVETVVHLFGKVYQERLVRAGLRDFQAVAEFSRRTPVAKCLDLSDPEDAPMPSGARPKVMRRKKMKSGPLQEWMGLCHGVLADGRITIAEVFHLSAWLESTGAQLEWPGSEVAECVERIVADGVVTKEEKAELKALIERVDDYLVLTGQAAPASLPARRSALPNAPRPFGPPALPPPMPVAQPLGWEVDPISNRQIKVLKFFGQYTGQPQTKGEASLLIDEIFADPRREHRWRAYVRVTGDTDQDSADLQPYRTREFDQLAGPAPREGSSFAAKLAVFLTVGFLATAAILWLRREAAPSIAAPTTPIPSAFPTPAPAASQPPTSVVPPSATPPPPAAPSTPTISTPIPSTAAESRASAIRRRPELAIVGSPLNREFVREIERLRRTQDPLLKDPRHPEIVADRAAEELVRRAKK